MMTFEEGAIAIGSPDNHVDTSHTEPVQEPLQQSIVREEPPGADIVEDDPKAQLSSPVINEHRPVVHPPVDPPICEPCQLRDLVFFDPQCQQCQQILYHPVTTIAQIFAIIRQWTHSTQSNLEVLVNEILKRGANINDRDGLTDMTLLHYVSKAGASGLSDIDQCCRLIHYLVSQGADIYIRCRWTNMTALHYATYFNVAPVVETLLAHSQNKDVDIVCRDFDSGTPLHIACANLCRETVKVLLEHGASPTAQDELSHTPRDCLPDVSQHDPNSLMVQTVNDIITLLDAAIHKRQQTSSANQHELSEEARQALHATGVQLGHKVVVGGVKSGILRYCGHTEFASGLWAGIELDEPVGKNNGSVMGVSYFSCSPKHGIFAPVSKISRTGILIHSRLSSTPRAAVSHKRVDTSHVSAKVDTGLSRRSNEPLDVGDRVLVAGQRRGVVQYSGEAAFAPGWWYGIELDRPVGKNDGSVNGQRYFTCKPKHGVFAPPSRVQKLQGSSESLLDAASFSSMIHRNLSTNSASQPSLSTTPRNKSSRPRSSGSSRMSLSYNGTANHGSSSDFKLCEGMSVFCSNELGIIRYIGQVDFAEGIWLGVELRTPKGKNDGSIQGRRYFTCRPGYGLLVRPSKVTVRGINGAKLLGDAHAAINANDYSRLSN